ncbi:MAG: hypothetical protein CL677_09650 [Bdellovibrionaceae bacterium]|nr:hypothetical protein [Pseudobdellovibrionaceae bacterium]
MIFKSRAKKIILVFLWLVFFTTNAHALTMCRHMFKPYSVKELLGYTGYLQNLGPEKTVLKKNLGQVMWFIQNSTFHTAYQKRRIFEVAINHVRNVVQFVATPFVIDGPTKGIAYIGAFPSNEFKSILVVFNSGKVEKVHATQEMIDAANRERSHDYYRIDSGNPFYDRTVEAEVNRQIYRNESKGDLVLPM